MRGVHGRPSGGIRCEAPSVWAPHLHAGCHRAPAPQVRELSSPLTHLKTPTFRDHVSLPIVSRKLHSSRCCRSLRHLRQPHLQHGCTGNLKDVAKVQTFRKCSECGVGTSVPAQQPWLDICRKKILFIRIDGNTAPEVRAGLVATFQDESRCRVALLAIRAAGTGLTLTVRLPPHRIRADASRHPPTPTILPSSGPPQPLPPPVPLSALSR